MVRKETNTLGWRSEMASGEGWETASDWMSTMASGRWETALGWRSEMATGRWETALGWRSVME